jgi:hypothetical protein
MLLQAQGSWLAPPCRSEKDLTLVWGQTANLSSFRGYRPRLVTAISCRMSIRADLRLRKVGSERSRRTSFRHRP